jgi:Protein of unknown function (DUF3306)
MTEDDFLKRWSRRKREVAKQDEASRSPEPDVVAEAADAPAAGSKTETPFDPASLPPVESITSLSDITAFLRDGVPAELTRAALRRVWTADPAIRGFVGLAENAWDFTDPNGMPGFGPLEDTDEVRRMIARVVDEIGRSAQPVTENTTSARVDNPENSNNSSVIGEEQDEKSASLPATSADEPKQNPAEDLGNQVLLHSNREDIASQHDVTEAQEKPKQFAHRTHGRALPQ